MPDELPPSRSGAMPPPMPPTRPPVPGWMWLLFGFGMIPVGILVCIATTHSSANDLSSAGILGAVGGMVLGLPLLGGLALAARFYSDTGARIVGGVVFAVVLTVGVVGVLFAGCMCLLGGPQMYR